MIKSYARPSLVLTLICSLLLGFNGTASAHVLQENNGVSAVLHIPPDDNPVANRTTALHLAFSSEHGDFSLENCDCQVKVQRNGSTIQAAVLKHTDGGALEAVADVNFPAIGVYDVLVTGRSKNTSFQPFTLDYLERVATSATNSSGTTDHNGTVSLLVGTTSFILLTMVAFASISRSGRYKKKPFIGKK